MMNDERAAMNGEARTGGHSAEAAGDERRDAPSARRASAAVHRPSLVARPASFIIRHSSSVIHHSSFIISNVAAFGAAFGWIVFGGRYVAGGDVMFYTYPLRAAAWRIVRAGELPLWTPHILSGFPLLAMPQLALGYPPTWGHLFLPPHAAEQVFIFAPFLLAPAFTYAYARAAGRTPHASVVAGLAFAYGGLTTNGFGMNGLPTNSVVWLPLVLYGVERARTRPFVRPALVASLAYAMSVLSGFGQGFLYVGLIAAAYAAYVSLLARALPQADARGDAAARPGRARWRESAARWRPLAVAACALALGAGLGAFQILETMRAQRRSVRAAPSYEFYIEAAFTPTAAVKSFLAPLYHFIEVTTYVAPLAFLLALAAVASALAALVKRRTTRAAPRAHDSAARGDARAFDATRAAHAAPASTVAPASPVASGADARVFFWAALAALAFVLMLGDATPLKRWLFSVPVLNLFRRPSRHAFEWTFALAVLAAHGWDALAAHASGRLRELRRGARLRVAFVVSSVLLLAACAWLGVAWYGATFALPYVGESVPAAEAVYLRWKLAFTLVALVALAASACVAPRRARAALVAASVLAACVVEPCILVRRWWAGALKDAPRLTTPAAATRLLQSLPPESNRVYVRANSATEEHALSPRFDALDLTALHGLHNVGGYEQLFPARYARALGDVGYDGITPRGDPTRSRALLGPRSRVLDILNTTHLVTFADLRVTPDDPPPAAPPASLDPRWQLVESFDGVVVLRNLRAQPRAWLVAEAEPVDGEEALRRIAGESERDFDPRRTALLEVSPPELPPLPGGELAVGASARVASYGPNRLVIETESATDALLVVGEMFYPGWEATVDGREARIHLTNFLLRGVSVPAGAHRVEMRYRATAARNGAVVSALTLLLLCVLTFLALRRRARVNR